MNNNEISDLQIWNNAAFVDNGVSEFCSTLQSSSWCSKKPISDSLDSTSSKENQSPVSLKLLLHPNGAIGNLRIKPIKAIPKQGLVEKSILKSSSEEFVLKKIDSEIEETEKEIKRLFCRLEALRLEKAEHNLKMIEKRGRVVPAKFMEQKQCVKNVDGAKKTEETISLSAKTKARRRGVSLGPSEIVAGAKSGQLGKQEISHSQLGKQEFSQITLVQSIQNRRKSCFWKLQGIDEENGIKERRKSLNLSPKSRKPLCRTQIPRQAVTTVGLKKHVKKEDGVLQSIQPKKLFKDGEKSVTAKKMLKPGRVIASRYNQSNGQSTANSAFRKRSLPDNDKDESKRCDKKRASLIGKSRVVLPEISRSRESENSPISISVMPDTLPRIRTVGCTNDTPRDSGPAKKVAELIGKRSYFRDDEEAELSVCQELSFEEDFEDK